MKRKGIIKQWFSFLLVFLLGIQGGLPALSIFAVSGTTREVTGRSTTTSTFNMEWSSPTDGTSLTYSTDKQTCILKPKSNTDNTNTVAPELGTSAQCTVNFSLGGNKTAQPGEIQIRLPRYLFVNRNGVPQGDISLGISDKKEGTTGFYFYIDTKEDSDTSNDEIVLTNYKEIASAYVFTCAVRYFVTENGKYPSNIQNKYVKTFQGKLHLALSGNSEIVLESNSLSIQYNTVVEIKSYKNSFEEKYEKWQPSWGVMPADSQDSDYFYVVWKIESSCKATQPYHLTLNDTIEDGYGGKIIGGRLLGEPDITLGTDVDKLFQVQKSIPSNGEESYGWYILTKYPRTILNSLPLKIPQLSNKAEFTILGVDGTVEKVSQVANYTYVDDSFEVTGTVYSNQKAGFSSAGGGAFDKLDKIQDGESIFGELSYLWSITYSASAYQLTLRDGGNAKEPADYGKKAYEVEVIDDIVMLGDERLEKDDYQFTGIYLKRWKEYDYVQDTTTGKWVEKENTAYTTWEPMKLYYQIGRGNEWKYLVSIYIDNVGQYYETSTKDRVYINEENPYILPENVTAVKYTHESKNYSNRAELFLKMELKKSDRVKRIRQNKTSVPLFNSNTLCIYNSDGKWVNPESDYSFKNWSQYTGLYNEAKKQDTVQYGGGAYPCRSKEFIELKGYYRTANMDKFLDRLKNDVSNGRVEADYILYMNQSIDCRPDQAEDIKQKRILSEEKEGVFYDLLPKGMFVDSTSIKAQRTHTPNNYMDSSSFKSFDPALHHIYGVPTSVEYKENWRNSGRTMMIIHVKVPEGKENYYTWGTTLASGWCIKYTAYYPWESVVDYGNILNNSAAYQSPQGTLFGGRLDDGGAIADKAYMVDLNDDGNPTGTKADTMYAERKDILSLDTAADLTFSKMVKTANDLSYTRDTTLIGGSTYSYRLRMASQKHTQTGNIILYDALEQFQAEDTNCWYGKLMGIDISNVQSKGIDVQIYYSTKKNTMVDIAKFRDITNTEIWSKKAPDDLSDVTALAFDLRKRIDGSDYVMKPEETFSIELYMKSPLDKAREYEEKQAEARNSCWYSGYTKEITTNIVTERWLESPNTSVAITSPKIDVIKSANPATGTEQAPQSVEIGNQIVYDIGVINRETIIGYDQVELEDIIPEGLSVDISEIKWYEGVNEQNAESIKNTENIVVKQDRQNPNKLVFIISHLSPSRELHFIIPTVVQAGAGTSLLKNTANITKIEGKDCIIKSGTTYHSIEEKRNITVKKVWNDGNNQDGKRPEKISVQLLADGEETGKRCILEEGNEWKSFFVNLPRYKNGVEIQYEIQEEKLEGYQVTVEGDMLQGYTITNTLLTAISGTKVWDDMNNQDGKRPSTITIDLYGNGKIVDHQVVSGTALNVWEWRFENKPKFENNQEVIYTVVERSVENYQSRVNGYEIINRYTPGKINIPVIKQWDDGNNQDGKRPNAVTMKLYANGENTGKIQVLEESNHWVGNFIDLERYKDGVEIIYTVEEESVNSYTNVISGSSIMGYHVINMYKPELITVSGTSIWYDQNNKDKKRPNQVTIEIYANEVLIDKKQVMETSFIRGRHTGIGMENRIEETHWDWFFEDLPRYINGQEIVYTVKQSDVPFYVTTISGGQIEGFIIKNEYIPSIISEEPLMPPALLPVQSQEPVIPFIPSIEYKPEEPVVNTVVEKPIRPSVKPTGSNYHINSNDSSQVELEKEQISHSVFNEQGKVEEMKEKIEDKVQKTESLSSINRALMLKTGDKSKFIIWIITLLVSAYIVFRQLERRFCKK